VNIEALVLIEGDPELQRLVATWPVVGVDVAGLGQDVTITDELAERWEEASGVDRDDCKRRAPALWINELLGPGGHVDPAAIGFIRQRIIEKLPKSVRERLAQAAG
jgi:hypothetical protein